MFFRRSFCNYFTELINLANEDVKEPFLYYDCLTININFMCRKYRPVVLLLFLWVGPFINVTSPQKAIAKKTSPVLKLMILEEKIGQMSQYNDIDSNPNQHPVYILNYMSLL